MKRSIWTRILAMLLIVSMLTVPVSAAEWNSRSSQSGWSWNWGSIWDFWFGGYEEEEPEPTEPEAELVLVEDASTVDNGELLRASTYTLTTEEESAGTNSANSYSLMTADTDAQSSTTTVKYFPVTMYNYDQDTINAATDLLDDDTTIREGFYFSNGGTEVPANFSQDVDMSAFVAGQYYIQNIRAAENNVNSWLQAHADNKIHGVAQADASVWTLEIEDGQYYLKTQIDGEDHYMVVGTSGDTDGYTTTKTPIEIVTFSGNEEGVQLRQNGYYLCQWGSVTATDFGGYYQNNDGGNGMRFYAVTDGVVSDTPTVITYGEQYLSSGYQVWNRWAYSSAGHSSQNKAYTGLVQDALIDDQIVFTVNEPGVFDDNAEIKDIYTYVGLPFVLDSTTGVYSFCSDDHGVYFADTDGDGTADPDSGTAEAPYNLYFDEGNTQGWDGMNSQFGDGSYNLWAPFNTNENDTGAGAIDYHFGMRADLPFSMTPNGRIKSTDNESDPITFSFQGDDDVWVFIDGQLVIDLGGIHNRLGATIDFAANTITYFLPESNNKEDLAIGSHNDPDFAIVQKLFTDDEGEGLINTTLDAFALDPDHEMQVFYLERGEGTSNAQIEFNLPMNDTVIVTKDATKSWSQAAEDADLALDPNDEDAGVDNLTTTEQAIVNNINFGFTLYKKTAEEGAEFEPVANTNFYLIGRDVEGTGVGQTDDNGHFYLKNGQSAKFITEIPTEGVTYYVVEDKVPDGFISPDYNFDGEATYDYSYTDGADINGTADAKNAGEIPEQVIPMPEEDEDGNLTWPENKSYEVTVSGSIEANDSIEFICSNFLDAELPNPTALTYEDIIVIDYGLPVNIDPLANDVFRGNNIEIVYFGDDSVTLTETTGTDGVVTATWAGTQAFHSGTVALNDVTYGVSGNVTTRDTFTYTLNKQLTEVEVLTYIIKVTGSEEQGATGETLKQYDYAIGKVYIVPATVMYYEENFSDLVTFKGTGWSLDGDGHPVQMNNDAYVSAYQEPGVVGTIGDSTYGSDVAYLSDSEDSNGTSYFGDTTNGAIQFTYTFTGTGTSFFARTSATTGYMQVKLYEGTATTGEYLYLTYRDTYYADTNSTDEDSTGTLYNIPVYTQEDLDYGTYTVVCTIAKAGTKGAGAMDTDGYQHSGNEFYLDGIRIVQPLNESNETVVNAETGETITDKALGAYATDVEANVEIVTLRYKLITDAETGDNAWNFVVLTDTNGAITSAEEYTSIGPKEEVYLMPGQSVSFAIKYWHKDGYMMNLGMKAPFGTATAQVGQKTFDLKNATDCYYNITDMQSSVVTADDGSYVATYTISATDKIVSLTNLKVTGNYEFVLIENTDVNVDGDTGEGE